MSTVYDYQIAVWLCLELAEVPAEFDDELREHLLEADFQVNDLKVIEDAERSNGEVQVSLRIQLTLDESEMDGDEPTSEAVAEFDEELRSCLSSKYVVIHLDVMDDSPYSCLLGEREEADARRYPEPKQRDLRDDEKIELRTRIERGDGDVYALAEEFGCSASQVAGIKAAMHR